MAYITKTEYDTAFPDNSISDNDFTIVSDIASNIVNRATVGKIDAFGLSNLSTDLQTKIKNCTSYQVNIIEENGGLNALVGNSDLNSQSLTVGKFSESYGSEGNYEGTRATLVEGIPISPAINIILHGTGLLNTACAYFRLEDFQ